MQAGDLEKDCNSFTVCLFVLGVWGITLPSFFSGNRSIDVILTFTRSDNLSGKKIQQRKERHDRISWNHYAVNACCTNGHGHYVKQPKCQSKNNNEIKRHERISWKDYAVNACCTNGHGHYVKQPKCQSKNNNEIKRHERISWNHSAVNACWWTLTLSLC